MWVIGIAVFLVFDALLHILIVQVKFTNTMVGVKLLVILVDDGF